MVIDEADRLLSQNFQDWLVHVLAPFQSTVVRKHFAYQPLHKMLFSATLTNNPQKLSSLHLNQPLFFCASQVYNYSMPDTLSQFQITCDDLSHKPLVMAHLLGEHKLESSLCFVSSVDSAHRLCVLLQAMGGDGIAEYSSNLAQDQREQMIADFNNKKLRLYELS